MSKKTWIITCIALLLVLGAAIIWLNIDSTIKPGEYQYNDGLSKIVFNDDGEFSLIRPAASMILEGEYEINGRILTLQSDDGEYEFLALGDKLIFFNETGKISAQIDIGATYYYKNEG